ncbi:hypothetical protein QJS10_CPB17g00108 [Acorus calamus]|uniref:Glutamine amidotransferase domain-containing protein n=1 Tax=Acorus calamus TaxID=4465 RepID=A0AAV9CX80_ACOCL|nr:hypothetical protein QJS10_CPB17g00108 [Acorus calamus]
MVVLKGRGRRYALLMAARDSDYVKKLYGGYLNVFVDAFGDDGDRWDLFRVVDGEFPEAGELDAYDGFVVSGSPYDAYGNDLWIVRLCLLLRRLNDMGKKVLGICFGHQVLCRALGGKVGRACNGWDIGVRQVTMVDNLPSCGFLEHLGEMPDKFMIMECHQDEVWEVPIGADVIAFSEKTGVEMFSIGDNILGIQGHPEYTHDILYNLIDRLVNNSNIDSDFASEARKTLEAAEPHRKLLEKMCKSFLKWR